MMSKRGETKFPSALSQAHCYAALEARCLGPSASEDREHLHVKSGTKEFTRVAYLLHSSYYVMHFLAPSFKAPFITASAAQLSVGRAVVVSLYRIQAARKAVRGGIPLVNAWRASVQLKTA